MKKNKNCGCLYEIINNINNKKYIGITTQTPKSRWNQHKLLMKKKKNTPLYNSMNKYGIENFTFNVLLIDVPINFLSILEILYIKEFNLQNPLFGYNLAMGGKINKGYKIPHEVILKQKQRMTGKGNHFYGKHHKEETKMYISSLKKNKKLSEETKNKMSLHWKNNKNNWFGKRGFELPWFNKPVPEERKLRIQHNNPHRKEIMMIDNINNIFKKFKSMREAGNWLIKNNYTKNKNVRSVSSNISYACKNNTKRYNCKWEFINKGETTIPFGSRAEDGLLLKALNTQ